MILDYMSHFMLDHIKRKWPQIHINTKVEFTKNDCVVIDNLRLREVSLESYSRFESDVKQAISENLNCALNDNGYLVKQMRRNFKDFYKDTFYLLMFVVDLYQTREILECIYIPESDTLYIKKSK